MKQDVVVDGIRLSRAQIEKAYKELNTPKPSYQVDCRDLTVHVVSNISQVLSKDGDLLLETNQSSHKDTLHHSLYLNSFFNWELKDLGYCKVLVPTRRTPR